MRNIGKETNDKMLTIENINKIQNRSVVGEWVVKEVGHLDHNDCYYFAIYRMSSIGPTDRCKIMLERNYITQRSSTHPDSKAYFFICDSKRTNTCGTADWLGDMDNMIKVFADLIEREHIKL